MFNYCNNNCVLSIGIVFLFVLMAGSAQAESIQAEALQYDLPLSTEDISNFDQFSSKVALGAGAIELLEKNGFVALEDPFTSESEDIAEPYKRLKDDEIPIFITTDSLLHIYHIQFDETLRGIEEREFYDDLWQLSKAMLDKAVVDYANSAGDAKEAAKMNMAFFSVGLTLLEPHEDQLCLGSEMDCEEYLFEGGYPYFKEEELDQYNFQVPSQVKSEVESEIALIDAHLGFADSPIFGYKEDYSQYIPRGHYTRSEKLKNYFRAMMWYGRMGFLLKGCQSCIVSAEDAANQTIAASMISQNLKEDANSLEKWDRIYNVTSFYVGYSDDLGPYQYNDAISAVFGGPFKAQNMTREDAQQLKAELASYRIPQIYGGTGFDAPICQMGPPLTPDQADQCLAATAGLRLMGQRFIPDSYIFQNMVFPYCGKYTGDGAAFTSGMFGRHFPRGLDVMALLGSQRALEILLALNDSNYESYMDQYAKLDEEFGSFDEKDWQKNLYWAWLYALQPLLEVPGSGYPTFMQTTAWQDKELTTALASWTELRHDTILYAKQSYTMVGAAPFFEEPEPVVGYVEPVPEFYDRLLVLTRMTNQNLTEMGVLDDSSKWRLDSLESILERLVRISEKELNNENLSDDDYEFIDEFGERLDGVLFGVEDDSKKTTIVADVHTDSNTQQVLEEGVGCVRMMIVAYKVPDGRIIMGAGPVFSYYEFKQPMSARLTDEAWREMLKQNPPKDPEWICTFSDLADDLECPFEESDSVYEEWISGTAYQPNETELALAPAEAEPNISVERFNFISFWNFKLGWFADCTLKLNNSGEVDGMATIALESGKGAKLSELEIQVPAGETVEKKVSVDVSKDDREVFCKLVGQRGV